MSCPSHANRLSPNWWRMQRDVPGITRSAMADLNFAGITALSQGVNGASAPPDIPKNTPVVWKDVASRSQLLHWVHAGNILA